MKRKDGNEEDGFRRRKFEGTSMRQTGQQSIFFD